MTTSAILLTVLMLSGGGGNTYGLSKSTRLHSGFAVDAIYRFDCVVKLCLRFRVMPIAVCQTEVDMDEIRGRFSPMHNLTIDLSCLGGLDVGADGRRRLQTKTEYSTGRKPAW